MNVLTALLLVNGLWEHTDIILFINWVVYSIIVIELYYDILPIQEILGVVKKKNTWI